MLSATTRQVREALKPLFQKHGATPVIWTDSGSLLVDEQLISWPSPRGR